VKVSVLVSEKGAVDLVSFILLLMSSSLAAASATRCLDVAELKVYKSDFCPDRVQVYVSPRTFTSPDSVCTVDVRVVFTSGEVQVEETKRLHVRLVRVVDELPMRRDARKIAEMLERLASGGGEEKDTASMLSLPAQILDAIALYRKLRSDHVVKFCHVKTGKKYAVALLAVKKKELDELRGILQELARRLREEKRARAIAHGVKPREVFYALVLLCRTGELPSAHKILAKRGLKEGLTMLTQRVYRCRDLDTCLRAVKELRSLGYDARLYLIHDVTP